MLLIHNMSSQSQGILDVASNANADPLSKNWGFQHISSSSSPAYRFYFVPAPNNQSTLEQKQPLQQMLLLVAFPAA